MDSRLVSERIARMEWIDDVAIPLQRIVGETYRALGPVGQKVERFLHGGFLGHPLHSISVHLPIGAWVLAALLDPWGRPATNVAADYAVALGVIGALGASLTGATDYYVYKQTSIRRIGGLHAILNWTAIFLYALSWLARHDGFRDFARLLSYGGFFAVAGSGYLGGLMVYEKRLGTNHAPIPEDDTAPEGWTAIARLEDIPEGIAFRADAGDVPLVLVRRGEAVDPLANACAHQGGPLREGRVVDGCVECPWHATRFALASGASVSGPSVYAQPRYPVRIVDGTVEVEVAAPEALPKIETPEGRASLM